MKLRSGLGILLGLLVGTAACGSASRPSGGDLAVRWTVLRNYQNGQGIVSRCQLDLANRGESTLPGSGWSIYFNSPPIATESVQGGVVAAHLNGDFFRITPGESFEPLAAGESRRIEFDTRYALVSESSAPAGFYLVWDGEEAESAPEPLGEESIGPFERPEQVLRSPADKVAVPTPASNYEKNSTLSTLGPEEFTPIVPTPVRLERGAGNLRIGADTVIRRSPDLAGEAEYLASTLQSLLGKKPVVKEGPGEGLSSIVLRAGPVSVAGTRLGSGDEAYRLRVSADNGVEIVGSDPAGVFYGVQSLLALLPVESWRGVQDSVTVGEAVVEDAPRFPYRGMHLDVARNFQSKEEVKKFIDLMAAYKLNRFHFHLSDDEGWRLPVQSLPELTDVGSRRGHTLDESDRLLPSLGSGPFSDPGLSHGSGHYTREDFVEILRYAHARHIEVIPEIDAPGHSRAAIKAMDARRRRLEGEGRVEEAKRFALSDPGDQSEYRSVQDFDDNVMNVCQESTYRFVEAVVDELVGLYQEAEAPLTTIHTGGDEVPHGVWEKSPACRRLIESGEAADLHSAADLSNHFLRRVHEIVAKRGLVTAGWEEIALTRGREGEPKEPNPVFADQNFRAYVWNSVWGWGNEENAYRLANAGYPVVLCNASNLYFDMAYDKDPREPGLAWAAFVDTRKAYEFIPLNLYWSAVEDQLGNPIDPAGYDGAIRLTGAGKRNVLGIQGQLWGETAKGGDRMEYLAFPKLLGLAERAWAAQPSWAKIADPKARRKGLEADWNRFANALGQHELPRLDYRFGGVHYRLPPPGFKTVDGVERSNVAFPGLKLERTDQGWATCDTRGRCRTWAAATQREK